MVSGKKIHKAFRYPIHKFNRKIGTGPELSTLFLDAAIIQIIAASGSDSEFVNPIPK